MVFMLCARYKVLRVCYCPCMQIVPPVPTIHLVVTSVMTSRSVKQVLQNPSTNINHIHSESTPVPSPSIHRLHSARYRFRIRVLRRNQLHRRCHQNRSKTQACSRMWIFMPLRLEYSWCVVVHWQEDSAVVGY